MDTISKRVTFSISIIAISISICGLIFQYQLLRKFGFDLSNYADIDDLFIGSIKFFDSALIYINEYHDKETRKKIIIPIFIYFILFLFLIFSNPNKECRKPHSKTNQEYNANFTTSFLRFGFSVLTIVFLIFIFLLSITSVNHTYNKITKLENPHLIQDRDDSNACEVSIALVTAANGVKEIHDLRPITGLNSALFFYNPEGVVGERVIVIRPQSIAYMTGCKSQ